MHQYLLESLVQPPSLQALLYVRSSIGHLPPYDHKLDSKKKKATEGGHLPILFDPLE